MFRILFAPTTGCIDHAITPPPSGTTLSELHIQRAHTLGLDAARRASEDWSRQMEHKYGMTCTRERSSTQDLVRFSRPGALGSLLVTATQFDVKATLGFVLSAFQSRIEAEIVKNLDALLAKHRG
jgi:putative polyhydroxyalkanoate system protein